MEHSLTINDTNYIRCTSTHCSQVVISFSEPSTFPGVCEDNNDDTNIYEYASTCRITYRINYDHQQIHVDFNANNDTDNFEGQKSSEIFSQTLWLRFKDGTHTPNEMTRKYDCNTKDDCARDFYLKTINYLVNDGRSQLDLIKNKLYNDSLIIGENSKRRCTDSLKKRGNNTSRRCGFGLCFVRLQNFELNEEQNSKDQKCEPNNKPILFSEIDHHTPQSPEQDKELLEYTCNKNVCNRNDLVAKIQSIINEYTNWNGLTPESKSIHDKAGSFSIKQTVSSYALVLFILFLQFFI
jgi:hypothetical protein